ncbi:ABC transporter permease [Streptomyces caniscabiei]|uniref:ABC transporter permease n=1 Tax=Streptomyces caniscabiei TaxID=2746961 RepID=UPI0029BE701B|nr:ABC transporter permease [Streptomyces caniscabiei]MDX2776210.1 ABC transporter permease [Streptomyces caniscabiei]
MKTRDIMIRAGRSLRHAKARTLLTSLAISVGAFTVTMALAAGAGGRAYTDSLLQNNGDAKSLSVLVKEESTDAPKEYDPSSSRANAQGMLSDDDLKTIKDTPGIAEASPSYSVSAAYMTRDGQKKYETTLSIKDDETAMPLSAGSLQNNRVADGTVVISEKYLSALGFSSAEDAIGKTLTLRIEKAGALPGMPAEGEDRTFTIQGVDKESSTVLMYSPAVHLSVNDGKSIYDYQMGDRPSADSYYRIVARVADDADVAAVKKAVEDKGYRVMSLEDAQKTLMQFIDIVQWGAAGFGFLAILASIFGIINTQYISVLERTQQIGLMKALGARRRDIGRLFRYEAAWVGFLGGLIGTLLAYCTGLLNPWIASSLSLEKGTELLKFDPITSAVLIATLVLVAVLAGYFPARKAAKLDPIEALRTE